jgi:uridine kinase
MPVELSLSRFSRLIMNTAVCSPFLIGVDGPGGSGKTRLARLLCHAVSEAEVVETDSFYTASLQQADVQREYHSFDLGRLEISVLARLKDGEIARYQEYDWGSCSLGGWRDVGSTGVTIVEGVYALKRELRDYYDATIWVETPRDIRLERGVERDGESSRSQWVKDWMPLEDEYINDPKENPEAYADVVVSGEMSSDRGEPMVTILENRIR